MADYININIGTLAKDINSMKTELEGLRNSMEHAFETVNELNQMWKGPANDAFKQAFLTDKQMMNDMCDVIQELIGYMENARDEYRKCESLVSSEIDSIKLN